MSVLPVGCMQFMGSTDEQTAWRTDRQNTKCNDRLESVNRCSAAGWPLKMGGLLVGCMTS